MFATKFAFIWLSSESRLRASLSSAVRSFTLCSRLRFAGVPSLSVEVSQSHLQGYASFDEVYGGRPGSLQNFPGIVWPVGHREAVGLIERSRLGAFAVEALYAVILFIGAVGVASLALINRVEQRYQIKEV